jgi:hypothetical protein
VGAWAGLLLGLGGFTLTMGEGLLLLAAGVVAWRRPGGLATLACASAVALLAGETTRAPATFALATAVALAGHLLSHPEPSREPSPWVPSPWLVLAAGAVGAALLLVPQVLPIPEMVHARPLPESVHAAAVLLVAACAMALLCRLPARGPLVLGLALAGVVPLGRAAWLVASTRNPAASVDRLSAAAEEARALGLARLRTGLVRRAMTLADAAADVVTLAHLAARHAREDDLTRLDPEILRLGARGAEGTGAPASDVDARLQRALKRTGPDGLSAWDGWPGRARTVDVARRAMSPWLTKLAPHGLPPVSRAEALDCFGGAWCLVGVVMPDLRPGEPLAPIRLRFRRVAPPVGDVRADMEVAWRRWRTAADLPAGAAAADGEEVVVAFPLLARDAIPGHHEVWLRLVPTDGGAPLRLGAKPGHALAIGRIQVPAGP